MLFFMQHIQACISFLVKVIVSERNWEVAFWHINCCLQTT